MENIINTTRHTRKQKQRAHQAREDKISLTYRSPFKSFLRACGDFVVVEVFGGFALLFLQSCSTSLIFNNLSVWEDKSPAVLF